MKTGDTYRNFVVKLSQDLPEIESKLIEVEHTPTGATIMMIVNDDDEMCSIFLFGLARKILVEWLTYSSIWPYVGLRVTQFGILFSQ